ncbi:AraC family transcriptional regulator [Hylemonella gracilis]|uniref:AraC family transcriptional regulator n=1 Tax=Hylemonella gracilis TaxID=80880 RepID=A0A4P6URV6_9BURK|nr:anthranilate 1,2-dioxygenase regulatory protein AndR [Hylemonella gracilis]QBK06521.1 AraC family transcriptional regulator [Hylemonella gracilis]
MQLAPRTAVAVTAVPGPFEPQALRAHRLFESGDLDEARERISRVMQPHRLQPLGAGLGTPSRSHMDYTRLGDLGLGTIAFFGQPTRVDVEAVEDYHLLMFCLRGHAQVRSAGQTLTASTRSGVICAPGHSFLADLSPDCEQFVLRLDRRMVEAHLGLDEMPARFHAALDLRRPALQAWLDQLRLLAASPALLDTARRHPLVAVEMERLLVHLLHEGQGLGADTHDANLQITGIAPACVLRAERYMEEHAGSALRLVDIATAAGTPTRTLLEAFKRFRATSPMQHLQALRLERAHALLRAGASEPRNGAAQETTSVATIAFDCGFTHLGRFAQAYRRRYGVPPSVTLTARR